MLCEFLFSGTAGGGNKIDGKTTNGPTLDTPQALTLQREPKANVERYDGLRAQIAGGRHAS